MPLESTGPADPSVRTPLPDPPTDDPAADPAFARSSADRYELLEEVGRGGMGVVLRGRDPALGRDLAVKVLNPDLLGRPAYVRRFVEEAQVGGQLQHPGVVPVYDLGRFADGRPFFAMKLVKGRTLADLLKDRPDPAADRAKFVGIFLQVCQAIGYAHSRGVIHRDLKPANVMVGNFGEVLVMDWGLAKVLTGPAGSRHEPDVPEDRTEVKTARAAGGSDTAAGSALGTPAYMSPEQAGGELDKLDPRADVFGLGAMLCVVLTGHPPYRGADREAVRLMAVRGQTADAFARLDGCGADAELVGLCKRCLAADRDDRPRDGGAVAEAVAAYRTGVEERARRAEVERAQAEVRVGEERKRRRVQLALAASVLGVVGLAGFGAYWRQKTEADRREELARLEGRQRTELAWLDGERKAEQAKVDAERTAARERLRENVGAAVRLAAGLRTRYRFEEAKKALDQARDLIPADGPADLRATLDQATTDLAFVVELDAIRMKRSTWIAEPGGRGTFDYVGVPLAYREAFRSRGLDPAGEEPTTVGGRVRASAIPAEVVAALDDWAVFEPDIGLRDRVLAIAAAADPGPWLDRFRDPSIRADKAKVVVLAKEAEALAKEGKSPAPGTLTALAGLMDRHRLDPTRVLLVAQFANPQDFLIPFGLGLWSNRKDDPEAIGYYRAARVNRPGNLAVLNNLGLTLYRKGDLDGAVAAYREVIKVGARSARAYCNLGNALHDQGDLDGAMEALREALRADPKDAAALTNLGSTLYDKRDLDGALGYLREAVRLDPGLAQAHSNLGVALGDKGDSEGAEMSFQTAIRLDPNNARAHYNLGVALKRRGDVDGAIGAYREAIKADPKDAPAHLNLGNALSAKGDPDGAIASYREAIRLDPKLVVAHVNLGNALFSKGELDAAIASHREAVRLAPQDALAHYNLGVGLMSLGDLDAATASLGRAAKLDPGNPARGRALAHALRLKAERDGTIAPPPREVKR